MLDREEIKNKVLELMGPLLAGRQTDLVDLTCRYEGGRMVLRFLVDTARGIRLDELSGLNQAIGALLEERNLIPEPYVLEVNSPGLDRPLKTGWDFERVIGRRVKVSTLLPVDGKTEHSGELRMANEEAIVLEMDAGGKRRILLSQIARATQEVDL